MRGILKESLGRPRAEIHEETQRIGLSWNSLLARTAEDPALGHVVEQLRKDRDNWGIRKF